MSFDLASQNMTVGAMIARGILLLILGILFVIFPFVSSIAINVIAGIFMIVFGITAIAGGTSFDSKGGRALGIILGILLILLGICALFNLWGFSAIATYFIGAFAFVYGIYELIAGIVGGDGRVSRGLQIAGGIVGIIFGILIFCWPFFVQKIALSIAETFIDLLPYGVASNPGILLTILMGIFGIIYGIILIIEGIVVHSRNKKAKAAAASLD